MNKIIGILKKFDNKIERFKEIFVWKILNAENGTAPELKIKLKEIFKNIINGNDYGYFFLEDSYLKYLFTKFMIDEIETKEQLSKFLKFAELRAFVPGDLLKFIW